MLIRKALRVFQQTLFNKTAIDRLVKDPTTKGIRRANYTKSTGDGKHWTIKPKSEWIEIPYESVVDEYRWNKCNQILESQEKKRTVTGLKTVHLLAGFVYCTCENKMYVYTETPSFKCKPCKRKISTIDLDGNIS